MWGLGEGIAIAQGWPKTPGPLEEMGFFCVLGKKLRGNKGNRGSDLRT